MIIFFRLLPGLLALLYSELLLAADRTTSSAPEAGNSEMIYRYWDWGKTPKRDDYQVAALRLALEKTKKEYGNYKIIRHKENFTTSRVRREVNRGEIVNIQAGPWRSLETEPAKLSERSIRVDVPLLKGLLGYRQLIIRRGDLAKFNAIKNPQELKQLVSGQARGWQDVDIYRYNGYAVDDEANLPTLFAMLNSKRFDYLPMSIAEVATALETTQYRDDFIVAPDIIIYYPFPIIFYVSEHSPVLAERLNKGMKMAEQDGSLDKLFNQYFLNEISALKSKKLRRFVLKNPFIPASLNQERPILLDR